LAKCIGLHCHTLQSYLKKYNVDYKFSIITDEQLDTITKLFKQSKVNSGLQYLTGFLSQHDVKIQ
ncbi:hypothetical protein BDP27DRAFT_1155807, partial [Rhodocollybia butyracea]